MKIMNRNVIKPNACCTLLNTSPLNDDFQDTITFQICYLFFFVQINICCKFRVKILLNRIWALNRVWRVFTEAQNYRVTFAAR